MVSMLNTMLIFLLLIKRNGTVLSDARPVRPVRDERDISAYGHVFQLNTNGRIRIVLHAITTTH